jgi:hypothetical protein
MRRRAIGDQGQIAGIEAVPFGLLVFVTGALVVAHAWGVVDAKFLAATAAREATRASVEAPSAAAAADAIRSNPPLTLRRLDSGFDRCRELTIEARYDLPSVGLPWGGRRPAVVVRARHTEVVDPFRDGLPGLARCEDQP